MLDVCKTIWIGKVERKWSRWSFSSMPNFTHSQRNDVCVEKTRSGRNLTAFEEKSLEWEIIEDLRDKNVLRSTRSYFLVDEMQTMQKTCCSGCKTLYLQPCHLLLIRKYSRWQRSDSVGRDIPVEWCHWNETIKSTKPVIWRISVNYV